MKKIARGNGRDARGGQGGIGILDAAGQVHGPGQVAQDDRIKAEMLAVEGGEADAEIVCEAGKEEAAKAALAEVAGEAGLIVDIQRSKREPEEARRRGCVAGNDRARVFAGRRALRSDRMRDGRGSKRRRCAGAGASPG